MKIAVFTDVFLEVPGGIPSSIKAQKKSLEALGHEVVIFCPGFVAPEPDVVLVPTHKWLKPGGAPFSKAPEKVMEFITREFPAIATFDLIHVHYEGSCSIAGCLLARKLKIPLVQTMHGREDMAVEMNIPHPFKTIAGAGMCFLHSRYIPHTKKVRKDARSGSAGSADGVSAEGRVDSGLTGGRSRRSFAPTIARAKMWELMVAQANFADIVITPSEHFARKLRAYGVTRQIMPVSNGVADMQVADFEKMAAKKKGGSKPLLREMKGSEPLRLFWNSRLSNEKRIMPFLQALALMKKPYAFEACGDGNALKKAKRFAAKHKLNAKFYGRVAHEKVMEKMLSQHLSVTVSYGFDTQGLTLLEAEATGMPVFFCDPDMKEIVPLGGAVVAEDPSPEAMANALDGIAPEDIAKMSAEMLKCRKEVLQSTQIKKLLAVYKAARR